MAQRPAERQVLFSSSSLVLHPAILPCSPLFGVTCRAETDGQETPIAAEGLSEALGGSFCVLFAIITSVLIELHRCSVHTLP